MEKAQLIALLGAVVALCLPAGAAAEYYVPPGNSGANQYTEALPGAGGDSGGENRSVTPAAALGERNAKRLEDRGAAGEAAAQLAADTAPAPQLAREEQDTGRAGSSGGGRGGSKSGGGEPSEGDLSSITVPAGSSGVGELLGQATGTSGGNVGLWLPLAIIATLAGSILYRVRLRSGPTA